MRIKIKPLSVNGCWQGRRYKTKEYLAYEKMLLLMLPPKVHIPEKGKLDIYLEFGMSGAMDYDNPVKPFQDVLQKKYKFNDNRIYKATIVKVKVKRGEEYIEWKVY